jgi:hypothetical protein
MSADEVEQGRQWVEQEIAKTAHNRGIKLTSIEWHHDFDRDVYWIETAFDGHTKRWKFSREKLEDCPNDKGVQRDLAKANAFFVPGNALGSEMHGSAAPPPAQATKAEAQEASTNQQNSQTRLLRVFLCHSKRDKAVVRKLYRRLELHGVEAWFDEESLLPGEDWELAIKKAVSNADVVLACISQTSVTTRGFAQKEIKLALDVADQQPEGTIYVVPVRLDDCEVPDRLRRWHWVNLFEENGFDKLTAALKRRADELGIERKRTRVTFVDPFAKSKP